MRTALHQITAVAVLLILAPPASAQLRIPHADRETRVVLHSPHFDEEPMLQGLGCPSRPLRLFGIEDTVRTSQAPVLAVRVMHDGGANGEFLRAPLALAWVRLSAKWNGTAFVELPDPGGTPTMTDASGMTTITAPAGIYRILILRVGYRRGEGIIQLRPAARDSVRAVITQLLLC